MADLITGLAEASSVSAELISSIVQDYLHQETKLLPTVIDYSSLALQGFKKIQIPKLGGFSVDDKVSHTAVNAQALTYTTDEMDLNKHKVVQWILEKSAALQATPNMLQNMAERAGFDIAGQVDKDLIAELANTASTSPDHRIAYANATALGKLDILAARTLLNKQNVPLTDRYLVVNPDSESALLQISDFVLAASYGSADALKTGELGRLFGFTVIMHNYVGANQTLAYHKSHVGVAIQQGVVFDTQKDLANLGNRYSFDQIYGVKVLDGGKRGVLLGSAS